jgi:hypothetical protein
MTIQAISGIDIADPSFLIGLSDMGDQVGS